MEGKDELRASDRNKGKETKDRRKKIMTAAATQLQR